MEKLFKLKAHGTNVRNEIIGGITTFLAMAYILAVNPSILSAAGMPAQAVFAATAVSAAFATMIMAFFANYPVVLASGMGLNAYFAYTVVPQLAEQGITDPWRVALTAILMEGIIFILLSFVKFRETLVNKVPENLKLGISAGIGLFIVSVGLTGAEAVVPDLMDFMNYSVYNSSYRHKYLGKGVASVVIAEGGVTAIRSLRKPALEALEKSKRFEAPMPIKQIAEMAKPLLSIGNQYGEGWFLTGEMAELIASGVPNIVCIQPFACLPNHVVGKGVIKALKNRYPEANVVAVDYDPGASEVNQLNRIKLMLSAAHKALAAGGN